MTNPATTADTALIARQIFGRMGARMIAAHSMVNHGNALSFKFKGSRSLNYCKITLMSDDTYNLTVGKIRKYELTKPREFSGVYADQLGSLFERETGLYLSL